MDNLYKIWNAIIEGVGQNGMEDFMCEINVTSLIDTVNVFYITIDYGIDNSTANKINRFVSLSLLFYENYFPDYNGYTSEFKNTLFETFL